MYVSHVVFSMGPVGKNHFFKMGLAGLHDFYDSWHLYIHRFLFGLLILFVASLVFMKGT